MKNRVGLSGIFRYAARRTLVVASTFPAGWISVEIAYRWVRNFERRRERALLLAAAQAFRGVTGGVSRSRLRWTF